MDQKFYVYILSGQTHMTLYIGVTNDLARRIDEHRQKLVSGFTKKYNLSKLIHYEVFYTAYDAITREKQLKSWCRSWKLRLIEKAIQTFEIFTMIYIELL